MEFEREKLSKRKNNHGRRSDLMKRWVSGLLILSFFSACAVGPNYKRPKVNLPETFRGQEKNAETSPAENSLANLPWWEVFQDETLQGLIRTALEQNKDLKIAAARIEEARGLYRMKRGEQYPEIGAVVSGSQTFTTQQNIGNEGNLGNINRTYVAVGGTLSYEADLWGRYRRGSEAARAELFAQEDFRRNVLITLISDVARAYFELRELDEELGITKTTAGIRRKSLKLIRIRMQGGVVSLLDVRQSEAELAIAARDIPELERRIALKENEINLLLGQNPGSITRGEILGRKTFPPKVPLDLPSNLLDRRPDIVGAEHQLVAANARIGEAKALFFPQINLGAIVGAAFISGPIAGWTGVAALGGNLFQSIFDAGKRKGNLQAAKARFEQALQNYLKVIQQSLREVSDSLTSIDKLKGVRKEMERLVAAAQDGLRLANARYEGGVSSYLEVLEAERQSYNSQLTLTRTKKDQLIAIVQLYRALGGGWKGTEKSPESQASKTQASIFVSHEKAVKDSPH
jgi:multidrug efflux system outer membrane protein